MRRTAVADDVGRLAQGGGDETVADDQQTIIGAGNERLDEDAGAFLAGGVVGADDLLARAQVGGDAAAVIAVLRLDDDRQAEFLGGAPGVVGVGDGPALRHRHADRAQQSARQLLVLGDHLGDGTGAIGFGGADAALQRAVAELDETAAVEAAHRDAAIKSGADDGRGARAEAHVVGQLAQPNQFGGEVEGMIGQGGQEELPRRLQAGAAQLLLLILDDDAEEAVAAGGTNQTNLDRTAGEALQFQGHVAEKGGQVGSD